MTDFTPRAVEKIVRATQITLGETKTGLSNPPMSRTGIEIIQGELTSPLLGTPDGKLLPTPTTAQKWVPIPGDTNDPVHMQLDTTMTYKLVNRSETIPDCDSGTRIIFARVGNEWQPIWADC